MRWAKGYGEGKNAGILVQGEGDNQMIDSKNWPSIVALCDKLDSVVKEIRECLTGLTEENMKIRQWNKQLGNANDELRAKHNASN